MFTDTYYPEANGVATSVFQLKKELERRGHTVYIFTVSNPRMKEKEENVYRIKSIPFVLLKDRRVGCPLVRMWVRRIRKLELDVIHTQTEFIIGHIGRKAAKECQIPLLHTYHTIYEDYTHYLKVPGNSNLKCVARIMSRYICEKANEVIVPTEKVRNLLEQYGVRKPICVQPTGIDLSKFDTYEPDKVRQLKEQYGLERASCILFSVGRLAKEKNPIEILRYLTPVLAKDSGVKFLFVGDGPERKELENYVKEKNLTEQVRFTGEVSWKEIQNYYALGDVFVSASTSETQGLTYIEALAAGKPLLVRQDQCLADILEDGVNGYAFHDERSFLEGLQKLKSKGRFLKMKEDAKESVKHISSHAFGERLESVYESMLAVAGSSLYKDCEQKGA